MLSMIAIQERYIARVQACHTGHVRRVMRAARREAVADLRKWEFTDAQAEMIVNDARDMVRLEAAAEM